MIIEEYVKNFTPKELSLHELVKDFDESTLYEYVLKRSFYKEPSKEEIDKINDIYEDGVTYIEVSIRDKKHKLKLLNYEDKNTLNSLVSSYEKTLIGTDESTKSKLMDYKILITVALSLKEINGKSILSEADAQIEGVRKMGIVDYESEGIIKFLGLLPYVMIKLLFDKYVEFETRIYDIFSYESIRKKSQSPNEIA